MIKEALAFLSEQAVKTQEVHALRTGEHVTTYVLPSGEHVLCEQPIPYRNHSMAHPESFVEAVHDYGGQAVSIWLNGSLATAVLDDDAHRCSRIDMPIRVSEQFERLESDLPRSGMSQRGMISFLRSGFTGSQVSALIAKLRRIDFTRKSDGKSIQEHGRESLGRSVEAVVQGVEEIDDRFTIEVPFFAFSGFRKAYKIEVLLDIDVQEEKFSLCVSPDQIELARAEALGHLASYIEDETKSKPFLGSP